MSDPRNVAHDKKVMKDKEHHGEPTAPEGATHAHQPGKKTPVEKPVAHESHADKQGKAGAAADDDAAE